MESNTVALDTVITSNPMEGTTVSNNATPKVPLTIEEVTPAWLSSLISKPVSGNNFKVAGNAQEGTGFLSQIVRISGELELSDDSNNSNKEPEKINLIVKLLPIITLEDRMSEKARNIIIDQNYDVTEIKFYEVVKQDIVEELEELSDYLCTYYCGYIINEPRDSIIVLQDLTPQGYYTINFGQRVSMPRIEESVRFLAKFHYAGSAVAFRKKTPLDKLYPFLQGIPDQNTSFEESEFFRLCLDGMGKLDSFFEKQNCTQEMRDAFKRLLPNQLQMATSIFTAMYNYPSMIHGDLWPNNLLFTDDPNLTLKAIDWQLLAFGDAAYDLCVLILSILPASELNRDNVDKLVSVYLDTFEEYCTKNGLQNLLTRSRKEFTEFLYTFGLGYVYLWCTFSQYPFSLDLPKLVRIYEFIYKDADLIPFLVALNP